MLELDILHAMVKSLDIQKDRYSKARGGNSKLLDINCPDCKNHICFYQKDGPGLLKRMYLDRIKDSQYKDLQNIPFKNLPQFKCPVCNRHLGVPFIYKEEQRSAFRLFVGSVNKKIVKL